jgi:hypothetical protein
MEGKSPIEAVLMGQPLGIQNRVDKVVGASGGTNGRSSAYVVMVSATVWIINVPQSPM